MVHMLIMVGIFLRTLKVVEGDLILYTTPDAANRFGNDIWSKGLVIDTETYSQEEIQNIVRSMVDESRMTSNKLASDAHTKGLKYSSVADENGVIDLTTSPAGTYYIDFEIGEYANSSLPKYLSNSSLFYRLSSPFISEMICIFPYFCPYEIIVREIRESFI